MEDVKRYIKSLRKAGLYKARIEDGGKEIIFSDDTFEVKTLPAKAGTFDGTEEMTVIDIEKEKELARKTEARKLKAAPKKPIEVEEPESYRISASKKLFRVAIFVIPVLAAAIIFFLNNPSGKTKPDFTPEQTGTAIPVAETGWDSKANIEDIKKGEEITSDNEIDGLQTEDRTGKTGAAEGDLVSAKPQDGNQDNKPAEGKGDGDAGAKAAATQNTPKPKQQDIKPVIPGIQTVRIIKLPAALIRKYNDTLSRLVIPFIPVKIKVSGYLNIKISIDEKGKASAGVLSSAGFKVTPEDRRENLLNLIIKKISGLTFTPPQDKQGKPVRVSEFNIDYQAGKLKTRLILKKR